MTVEIAGIVNNEDIPKKAVVREKGQYHDDVMAVIAAMPQVSKVRDDDGNPVESLTAIFENAKIATVRGATLRSAGFDAIVRGSTVYVSHRAED